MANESELGFQSANYIHFRSNTLEKGMNSLNPPAIGSIGPQLFFYKDPFDIK